MDSIIIEPLVKKGRKKAVTEGTKKRASKKNITEKKPTAKSLKILEQRRKCIQKFRDNIGVVIKVPEKKPRKKRAPIQKGKVTTPLVDIV